MLYCFADCYINGYFKINGKKKVKMRKKGDYVRFKNCERNIKAIFMIYIEFESILVPCDPREPYTKKYYKHVACRYGHKLVCVDDKFSKPFKSYLCEHVVYIFVNNLIE